MTRDLLTRRRFITIAASAFGVAALCGRAWAAAPVTWRGSALGAQVSIEIEHPDPAEATRLIEASLGEVRRMERLFSLYQPDSAICELNRSGVLVAPDADMVALLQTALSFAEATGGAFDPTVQPLWRLYAAHFSRPDADPAGPPPDRIAAALDLVGHRGLQVSPDRIALSRRGAAITLNGIAQGYTTDRVVERLRRAGLTAALVDIGEIRAIGSRADGAPWRVGLADPETVGLSIGTVELVDRAIATSAGAGFRFDRDGRFTHLFDPATGRSPARYRSVSVIAPTATEADALSTAFSLLPPDRIAALVKARTDLTVRLLHDDGTAEIVPN